MNITNELKEIDNLDLEQCKVRARNYLVALQMVSNELESKKDYIQKLEGELIKKNGTH